MRWWCTDDRPRSVCECRLNLSALPSFLCVWVCDVCMWQWLFYFLFSESTGELKYGDVCDTFMHVKKVFSSFCVQSGQRISTLSLCPEKAIIFPNGSHIILLFMRTGYYTQGKSFWKQRLKCLRKKREKIWIIFYFFRTIIVKHRNLQCLFICFYVCFKRFHLFSWLPIF